jgi:hypothetical protein
MILISKDKTCFKCQKTGHIATHCKAGREPKQSSKDKDDDDESLRGPVSQQVQQVERSRQVEERFQETEEIVHDFATQLEDLENDSDLSDSDSDGSASNPSPVWTIQDD